LTPGIHRLAIPTPFAVGRVNCWLVEDDPLTLFDTGPNSGKALDELETGLAVLGHRIEDLERIVITHQHLDHEGLLSILARRSGAKVCALEHLAPYLAEHGAAMERDDVLAEALMLRHGFPRDVVIALRSMAASVRGWGSSCTVSTPLPDGGTLPFAGRTFTVHHRPGHSPSDTVFHDAEHGVVIGGDHLIKHISSNPVIARAVGGRSGAPGDGRPRALLTYMRSLRETQAMEGVDVVLPGHGENVTNASALIDERFELHERRAAKIGRLLDKGPRTAYEIAQALWGNVAVTQAYLTLSEVLGHVDLLSERGMVSESEAGGVARFSSAT
jgi:glyoxylase-like metal-dependent hydrolase (beta-lactamase superfamily II)